MSKHSSAAAGIAVSTGIGTAVYLLSQLLLAALVVKGAAREEHARALQIASGGLGALLGGLWAVKVLPWGSLPAALSAAAGVALVTVLAGLGLYGEIQLAGDTPLRLGVMLLGGVAAGLLCADRKRGGKRRRNPARTGKRK